MSEPEFDLDSEEAARLQIQKECRAFLTQFNYDGELGIFGRTWRIYGDLPLDQFRNPPSVSDRMILPGMEVSGEVAERVIRTFGGIWMRLMEAGVFADQAAFKVAVRQAADEAGAKSELLEQLVGFLTARFGGER